eukprot:11160981-Lingulodinium_polyedra.AAC.1
MAVSDAQPPPKRVSSQPPGLYLGGPVRVYVGRSHPLATVGGGQVPAGARQFSPRSAGIH